MILNKSEKYKLESILNQLIDDMSYSEVISDQFTFFKRNLTYRKYKTVLYLDSIEYNVCIKYRSNIQYHFGLCTTISIKKYFDDVYVHIRYKLNKTQNTNLKTALNNNLKRNYL